ncbi:formate dehydrogenase, partial [Mesorhizobium sp. M2D.F.Ca.ET.145.01.1.1]
VLVIQEPGAVDDGLFLRDSDGTLVAWDRVAKTSVNATEPDAKPALTGSFTVDGRRCVPVFQLIADRYLDESYAPDAVAGRCGIAADTIRRIAAELAHVAFEEV